MQAQNNAVKKRGRKFVYTGEDKLFRTRYDSIRNFSDGRAAAMRKGRWGYIDTSGKRIVDCWYRKATDYRGGPAG